MATTGSCGAEGRVFDRDRVCVLAAGHMPPHQDAEDITWTTGDEITVMEAFNRYAHLHRITGEERLAAFEDWTLEVDELFRQAENLGLTDEAGRSAVENWIGGNAPPGPCHHRPVRPR